MFNDAKLLGELDADTRVPDRRRIASQRHACRNGEPITDAYREYEMRLARAVLARNLDVARLGADAALALTIYIADVGTGYEQTGSDGFEISKFGVQSSVLHAARSYNAAEIANALTETVPDAPGDHVRRLAIARIALGDSVDEAVRWALHFLDRLHSYSPEQLDRVSFPPIAEMGRMEHELAFNPA